MFPGYFALVMATGIIAIGSKQQGIRWLAEALYIIAAIEELFDNRNNTIKAHLLARGPKKLESIPDINHYGDYLEAREQVTKLAIEWFDEHLKEAK